MKNVLIAVVAAVFTFGLAGYANAEHSNENPNGVGHQGEGQPGNTILGGDQIQAQGQAQGQLQGQAQQQGQGQAQEAISGSIAGALAVSEGSSSNSGANANSAIGVDVVTTQNYEPNTPSAPSVYTVSCQNGASASAVGGSGSIISSDVVCELYKVANAELAAYNQQVIWCLEDTTACDENLKAAHLRKYEDSVAEAAEVVANLKPIAVASKAAGYLVLPAGIIWLLLLL
jgi:hypothetical protein